LLHYDVANGRDFAFYNNSRPYTPVFAPTGTPEQQAEVASVCTYDGELDRQCAYDYYATGNADAASVTASSSVTNRATRTELGMFRMLLKGDVSLLNY